MNWRAHRTILGAALVVTLAISGAGCSYVGTTRLDYAPAGGVAAAPAPASIAVVPLQEDRPPGHYPSMLGRMFLTYIPLIPWINMPYERLDEARDVAPGTPGGTSASDEHFTVKMADAIAKDLDESGMFEEVQFVRDGAPDTDYVLSGKLRKTEFDVNATSYMLGMAGVLLWIYGIPCGSNAAEVQIDLVLRDRSGQTVWQYPLHSEASTIFTVYNSGGAPVSNQMTVEVKRYGSNDKGIDGASLWAYHAEALRSGMGEAKNSLAQYLAAQAAAADRGP